MFLLLLTLVLGIITLLMLKLRVYPRVGGVEARGYVRLAALEASFLSLDSVFPLLGLIILRSQLVRPGVLQGIQGAIVVRGIRGIILKLWEGIEFVDY